MQESTTRKAFTSLQPADLYRFQVRELREYAMFTIDTEGVLTSWNRGVENLFGYPESEWIGQNACVIFTPLETRQEVCESEMQKARDLGSATDIRWHRRKDGSLFFAHGFMNALHDDQGVHIGYVKVMSDETARKHLEDSLTESNAALEQFAFVASHDIQEPLRTMSAYAELLRENYQGKLDAQADQFLAFLSSAAVRMTDLVRDMLDYARVAGEHAHSPSIALDEDLETAITHLDEAIRKSGANITHDAMPIVSVDRGQMVRLFQNLIGNAVKYAHPGRPPVIHVASEMFGTDWIISVRDNGIGFDPQDAAVIFAPFKRLRSAEEYPGSGVGLAICWRIVKSMGGRIWAESKPGEGSTFFFSLPVEGAQPHPRPAHTTPTHTAPTEP